MATTAKASSLPFIIIDEEKNEHQSTKRAIKIGVGGLLLSVGLGDVGE